MTVTRISWVLFLTLCVSASVSAFTCPANQPDPDGLLCYPRCDSSYTGLGPFCARTPNQSPSTIFFNPADALTNPFLHPYYFRGIGTPMISIYKQPDPPPPRLNSNWTSYKFMTFNIRYANADDGVYAWQYRKPVMLNFLLMQEPDVLGTQEGLHEQLEDLRAGLSGYDYVGRGRNNGIFKGEHSAIFYKQDRFRVLEHGTFWLTETPTQPGSQSWGMSTPRIATWAILQSRLESSIVLLVYNLHLDQISAESRPQSVLVVFKHLAYVQESFPKKYPNLSPPRLLIMGDFNNLNNTAPELEILMGPGGMIDSYTLAHLNEGQPMGTFHGMLGVPRSAKLDYIFVRQSSPMAVNVLKAVIDTYNENELFPSDHFPVWSILDFPVSSQNQTIASI